MPTYMDHPFDWALLHRYSTGECSPAELTEIAQWVEGQPDRQAYLDSLRAIGATVRTMGPAADASGAWTRLGQRVGIVSGPAHAPNVLPLPRTTRGESAPRRMRPATAWRVVGMSALALIVLALGIAIRTSGGPGNGRAYATAPGERATVMLADGTQLTLAPASRLRVPATYGRVTRDVALEGEALFTVAHDAAHPFAVRAHGTVVQDIGTRFDVRAYTGDAAVRVGVAEGRVSVHAIGARAEHASPVHAPRDGQDVGTLMAGDIATVTDTAIVVARAMDVGRLTAWTDGRLVFSHTPLRDALPELERWYDVDVRLADPSLATERLTGSLDRLAAVDAFAAVAASIGVRVQRQGRTVILGPRISGAAHTPEER